MTDYITAGRSGLYLQDAFRSTKIPVYNTKLLAMSAALYLKFLNDRYRRIENRTCGDMIEHQ